MENTALKKTVLTALFAAAGTAGGFLFMAVPNVEIITALMFLAGYALGLRHGILASVICGLIYFGFNPQGMYPPLLIAQIVGLSMAPLVGWFYSQYARHKSSSSFILRLILALAAVISTLSYDVLTNLAFPISTGMNLKATLTVLLAGIPFSLVHIGGNIVIFLLAVPSLALLVNSQMITKRF